MENTTPKGANFLKVCGILMIIGGAVSIVVSIIGFGAIALLAAAGASSALLTVATILALVSGVIELIAGIIGVKNCKKPEAAGKCMGWGIVCVVVAILGIVLNLVAGGKFSPVSLVTSLIVPVLFIIGAVLNKKSA